MDARIDTIQRILGCTGALFHNLNPSRETAWQHLDLTMSQFKTLMFVARTDGGATSGDIAKNLGVGLSTVTGIVDRLTEQDWVIRREDPEDRRITRVLPTPRATALVDNLLRYRNEVVTALLARLNAEQLQTVEAAFNYLLAAADEMAGEDLSTSRADSQEAVA